MAPCACRIWWSFKHLGKVYIQIVCRFIISVDSSHLENPYISIFSTNFWLSLLTSRPRKAFDFCHRSHAWFWQCLPLKTQQIHRICPGASKSSERTFSLVSACLTHAPSPLGLPCTRGFWNLPGVWAELILRLGSCSLWSSLPTPHRPKCPASLQHCILFAIFSHQWGCIVCSQTAMVFRECAWSRKLNTHNSWPFHSSFFKSTLVWWLLPGFRYFLAVFPTLNTLCHCEPRQ